MPKDADKCTLMCERVIIAEVPRYREAKSNFGGKQMRRTVDRDRVGGTAQTRAGCCARKIRDVLGPTLRSHNTVHVLRYKVHVSRNKVDVRT